MSRLYSTFDEVTLPADVELLDTDHTLQTSTTCDAQRMARSTVAVTAASAINFFGWSPGGTPPPLTPTSGVPPYICGICTAAAAANHYLGFDVHGFSYCPGDGVVRNNAGTVDTFATTPLGKNIRFLVDPVGATATILVEGVPIGTFAITAGQAWQYAATVSGDAGQLAWQVNPGDTPVPYASDDLGWWEPSGTIEPVLLATEPYITSPDDLVPHEKYAGDIDRETNPLAISNGVKFWMMGASAPSELGSGGLVQIQVDDPNGVYQRLNDDNARDQRVPLIRVQQGAPISTAEPIFVGVLDHCEPDTGQTWRVYLRDQMTRLAVALRRSVFPPTADAGVAGKLRPTLIGPARVFTPELEDATARQYAIGDRATTGFGRVRDAGKIDIYGTDFEETTNGQGITFDAATNGRIVVEATSFGGSFDPLAPDYITAQGNFQTCTYDGTYFVPDGWTNAAATDTDLTVTERFFINASPQYLKCVSQPGLVAGQKLDTPLLQARRTYAYHLDVRNIPFYTDHTWDGTVQQPATLYLSPTYDRFGGVGIFYTSLRLTHTGSYAGVFTSPFDTDQPLCLVVQFNDIYYYITDAMAFNFFGLNSITINELPAVTDNVELDGPGLDGMLRELMLKNVPEGRGPIDLAEYATEDAQAIDAATNYVYGLRVPSSESPQVDELVQLALNSCTAGMVNDEAGLFRVLQHSAPEDVADEDLDGVLTVNDFAGELREYADLAENLTTRASGCRNYDPMTASEYGSTSLSDTPLAVRAQLAQTYQFTESAGVRLAARYSKAYGREPIKTMLDRREHVKAMIVHANTLYMVDRNFYVGPVFEPFGRLLKIGGVYKVTYKGFVDGVFGTIWVKKLRVLGFSPRKPSEQICNTIFWGAA